MFLLGLILGPALGLLAGDFMSRPAAADTRRIGALAVIAAIVVLFLPFINLDLRLGLVVGYTLGLLLSATPLTLDPAE